MPNHLGDRIKQARLDTGLTREQLAPYIGRTHSSVCRYEWGVTEPSLAVLAEIAKVTGKPLSFFVADEVAA